MVVPGNVKTATLWRLSPDYSGMVGYGTVSVPYCSLAWLGFAFPLRPGFKREDMTCSTLMCLTDDMLEFANLTLLFYIIIYHQIGLIRFKTQFIYLGCFKPKVTQNDIHDYQYCSSSSGNTIQHSPIRQKVPMKKRHKIHLSQSEIITIDMFGDDVPAVLQFQ